MKPPSFLVKVAIGSLLAVTAVMTLVGSLAYRHLDDHFQKESLASQQHSLAWLAQHFESVWPAPAEAIDKQCKAFAEGDSVRVTVIAADGLVLGESSHDRAEMKLHTGQDRPEINAALEGQTGESTRHSETLNVDFRYRAMPLRAGGTGPIVGVVRTAVPVQSIAADSSFIRNVIWWFALPAVLTTAVLAVLLAWWWYIPLRHVTSAARQIASGDLTARVRGGWTAELSRLASALNDMRESLARQLSQAKAQGEDLRTVVSIAREAILASDSSGRIVLANRAAIDMLSGGDDPTGKPLTSSLRTLEVVDAFNRSRTSGQAVRRQVDIEYQGRRLTLDVHAIPLTERSGSIAGLVMAHDVTDIVQSATVRAEFAANASHELRTPLAIMRGAVEAMELAGPEDAASTVKFRAMLERQITRLEDLTRDLLGLHAIESGKIPVRSQTIDLHDIAEWIQETFAEPASAKGVRLTICPFDASATIVSDRKLLDLILQNLLQNAIKFTPSGGSVECELRRSADAAVIRVTDTGCGIPKEYQSRVFERFFQVDRGRGGDARGTGLGLAIVKHACERLGARVELATEPGKGTTVTITMTQPAA